MEGTLYAKEEGTRLSKKNKLGKGIALLQEKNRICRREPGKVVPMVKAGIPS